MTEQKTGILIVGGGLGGVAAVLAALRLEKGLLPRQVHNDTTHLADFQRLLAEKLGFFLAWPAYAWCTPH